MIFTVGTTHRPATDLGYLLHKHPGRAQSMDVNSGTAHVFYPEASDERCTAAVLLEVDPVRLVKGRRDDAFALAQYVNDRPYVASSLLAVAVQRLFRTAMAGRCDARPDLVTQPIPLQLHLSALPCRGGADLARQLFEPLGWRVGPTPVPLDPELPEWGDAPYVDLKLTGSQLLSDALNQVYVLLPVLDDAKHYWVGPDEVDKLIRAGAGWLAGHPARNLISRRYLAHQRQLTAAAMERLADLDDAPVEQLDNAVEPTAQRPLAAERCRVVLDVLRAAGASRVADLGCGDGRLVRDLLADPSFALIIGADVSATALAYAERRLNVAEMSQRQSSRLRLFQSSLTYRDERLAGLDAAVLMEVIEHVDPPRLPALARSVFGAARPGLVLVTTPNAEHNVRFAGLAHGAFRHPDHRFEWTRPEFRSWASGVASAYGYGVRFLPVGDDDPEVGPPTQLAVFDREAA
ncbi:Ubiquinone biosynthesis O-methyltransferase [Mycobacterium simulans]|uniref:3' terminal RNA ribose 2'-O-methyltransferase Hen1 n=1 Tax=Mycobacterium simulans TaxID=627089 RepID=UPI00174A44B7|nr:3' terminal RNA ribose 2'-O-methyltransferase Hen1 [Mycobacterium simulans]SON62300.1 Ubiquinone biosynthesis O-methyltransferase [Mycobacterium simulans]